MFGRIFAISPGVRAHFAPGPCAFGACARRSATREKLLGVARFFAFSEQNKFGRGAGGEGEKGADKWKVVSPSRLLYQYHLIKFPTAAQLIAARMARGEENFGSAGVPSEIRYFGGAFAGFSPISGPRVEIQLVRALVSRLDGRQQVVTVKIFCRHVCCTMNR